MKIYSLVVRIGMKLVCPLALLPPDYWLEKFEIADGSWTNGQPPYRGQGD
jgi:hypothetical protein